MNDNQPILSRTSLHRAVSARHESVTRFLLEQGADARKQDGNGQTALHLAVQSGQEGLVKILLESKTDGNVQDAMGQNALFQAIRCDNGSMVKLLLEEESIDVNCRDIFGDVALHVAAENGSEQMIEILLSHGADIDA